MINLCELFIYLGFLSFYPYLIFGVIFGFVLGFYFGIKVGKAKIKSEYGIRLR